MNADPVVMEHFTSTLDRVASDTLVDRIDADFAAHGFGVWAVEVQGCDPFVGFVGLFRVGFEAQSPTGEGCVVTFEDIRFEARRLADLRGGG